MSVCIVGYGTSVPSITHNREQAMNRLRKAYESDNDDHKDELNFLDKVTKATKIETRYICEKVLDLEKQYNYQVPYHEQMNLWYKYATELATKSCNEAINDYTSNYNGSISDITHVISHSVTGWRLPGLTHFIIKKFGLSCSCRPIEANFNGCYGGTNILYLATAIVNMDPNAVILICDTEIMEALWSYPNINYDKITTTFSEYVALTLFGTGCGSLIIKKLNRFNLLQLTLTQIQPLWEIECKHQYSQIVRDSDESITFRWSGNKKNKMTYNYGVLQQDVCKKLKITINNVMPKWLINIYGNKKNVDLNGIELAIHCGGGKLMEMIKKFFITNYGSDDDKFDEDDLLKYSFDIYRKYGNQSGASIIFVLKNVCKNTIKEKIFFMSWGVGATIQIGSLKRLNLFMYHNKMIYIFISIISLLTTICCILFQ